MIRFNPNDLAIGASRKVWAVPCRIRDSRYDDLRDSGARVIGELYRTADNDFYFCSDVFDGSKMPELERTKWSCSWVMSRYTNMDEYSFDFYLAELRGANTEEAQDD